MIFTPQQAGFPFFQLDRFLKTLVQDLHKHVAISDEFPRDPSAKAKSGHLFDRRVVRIVTPGTLVDEKFINPSENNFLLVVHALPLERSRHTDVQADFSPLDLSVGLAWVDLSTGEFFTQSSNLESLSSEVLRIDARELVLSNSLDATIAERILKCIDQESQSITWHPGQVSPSTPTEWSGRLESPIPVEERDEFTAEEVAAGNVLLDYVKEKLLGFGVKLQAPVKRYESENMIIDKNSMHGLEILEASNKSSEGTKGSLLHSIRRTVTKSGARLLRERLSSPSTSLSLINQRLDLVEVLVSHRTLRDGVMSLLKRTFDSQRIAQKFALGRGDADDLVSLHRTITATSYLAQFMENYMKLIQASLHGSLKVHLSRFSLDAPLHLAARIAEAIDEDAILESHVNDEIENAGILTRAQEVLSTEGDEDDAKALRQVVRSKSASTHMREEDIEDENNEESMEELPLEEKAADKTPTGREFSNEEQAPWIMRKTASPLLQSLHGKFTELLDNRTALTKDLRRTSGASSLTLRWTPNLGHVCHVKGVRDVRASLNNLSGTRNVGSSKSTRTFYVSEWTTLGTQMEQVRLRIKSEEQRLFQSLRESVVENLVKIRRNAAVLDELDVACSFATLASENNFTRPSLNNGRSHRVLGGQHPTVMLGLEEQGKAFISNDCLVGADKHIWLITGPNMAGKSTFLRQNALISILAQVGSFVPAKYAEIGITDQIFSRIGSADNLYKDQSTFMVEMLETAQILKRATPRSFVIMDEVGRGTTPEDGIAISFACLHHIYNVNKCRTLFATHFHTLADRTRDWARLGTYCTDVHEGSDGSFTYVHRLRDGVNRESHALKVAQLAGLNANRNMVVVTYIVQGCHRLL